MAIQTNGDIVVGGTSKEGNYNSEFALARFTPSGQLDPTFGTGGVVQTSFSGTLFDSARAIAIQPDGEIVAVGVDGETAHNLLLARYNPDGSLDTSFGSGGSVVSVGSDFPYYQGLTVQSDGEIIVTGRSNTLDGMVLSFAPTGTLDSRIDTGADTWANAVTINSNGVVVVAESGYYSSYSSLISEYQNPPTSTTSATLNVTESDPFPAPVAGNDFYSVAAGSMLTVASPAPVAVVPVLRYGFDESSTGIAAARDSGAAPGAVGVLNGGATHTANTPGGGSVGALDLSAPGADSVNAGYVPKLGSLSQITLAGWINLQAAPVNQSVLVSDNFNGFSPPATGDAGWDLRIVQPYTNSLPLSASNFALSFQVSQSEGTYTNSQSQTTPALSAANQWIFVALTFDATGLLTYYVGNTSTPVSQFGGQSLYAYTLGTNPSPFEIGARAADPNVAVDNPPAWIDDLRVYDTVLTPAQLDAVRLQNLGNTLIANDTDPTGNPLTTTLAAGPSHGTLALQADGSFTYTPNPGFVGSDSFTYTASDGNLTSNPATVTINVTPPTANTTVWLDDSAPAGASLGTDGGDSWNWAASNPTPQSGSLDLQSSSQTGEHQLYFYGDTSAPLSVDAGDSLFAHVWLDPANPPQEVMLQWESSSGGWEHRAYSGRQRHRLGHRRHRQPTVHRPTPRNRRLGATDRPRLHGRPGRLEDHRHGLHPLRRPRRLG